MPVKAEEWAKMSSICVLLGSLNFYLHAITQSISLICEFHHCHCASLALFVAASITSCYKG